MIKKTMTYKDFNGEEREEDFFFNLSKAEVFDLECEIEGGFIETTRKMIAAKDSSGLFKLIKMLLLKAYGEKSSDGRRFMKSPEISRSFEETQAYSDLYLELLTDGNGEKSVEFIKAIFPPDLSKQ